MTPRRWLALEIVLALMVFAVLVSRVPTVEHFLANPDHAYQLVAGAEMLRGRVPGVDVYTNYGPLAVALPGIALWLSGGDLVAEVLICAAAWAGAVWIAFRLIRRNFGATAGWFAASAAFVCIPRFHKWWVWLVPMAALSAIDAAGGLPGRWRWFFGGSICGVGALLRPDLGGLTLLTIAIVGFADSWREFRAALRESWIPLAAGFCVPLVIWVAALAAAVGVGRTLHALAAIPGTLSGTLGSLMPLAPASAHTLALWLLPVVESVAVLLGTWLYHHEHLGLERSGRALMAVGLMGLSSYPHTIYRPDIHHFWQGMWSWTLLLPAFCAIAAHMVRADHRSGSRAATRTVMATAVFLVVLTIRALYPIVTMPHYDLAPYGRAPLAGLRELREGSAAAPYHPYAQLVDSIVRLTAPTDEILVLVYGPQLLLFSHRSTNGPTVAYQPGMFDSPEWQREMLAAMHRRPPALIVVPLGFWQLGPYDGMRARLPEITDVVREHYRRVVDRRGRFMLLAPDPSFRPPTS